MSDDLREWKLSRAKGAILEYIRGVKKRATLKWVLGVLKGSHGVTKEEALALLNAIENDPTVTWTPDRRKRLEELRRVIDAEW